MINGRPAPKLKFLPQQKWGLLYSAPEQDSSSLLNFHFRDPLEEKAVIIIVILIVGPLETDYSSQGPFSLKTKKQKDSSDNFVVLSR